MVCIMAASTVTRQLRTRLLSLWRTSRSGFIQCMQEMSQAIHEVTTKDNEKFDLIFSILTELQRRQAELEESVRGLKAHFANGGASGTAGSTPQQQPIQNGQQQQGG